MIFLTIFVTTFCDDFCDDFFDDFLMIFFCCCWTRTVCAGFFFFLSCNPHYHRSPHTHAFTYYIRAYASGAVHITLYLHHITFGFWLELGSGC